MLIITLSPKDFWNEEKGEFIYFKGATLELEHSLISLRKWEQRWHKPFLNNKNFSTEEILDYIRCMSIHPIKDPMTSIALSNDSSALLKIKKYIEDPMTATWFSTNITEGAAKASNEIITAEIIYYWMIEFGIPWECEKWHLRTLLTLIKVVDLKRAPKKKMDARTAAQERHALNEMRKKKWHTNG